MTARSVGSIAGEVVNDLAAKTGRVKQFPDTGVDMGNQQVITRDEAEAPVPALSETAAILQVIERAARDPSVDIDKLQQLMAMRERVEAKVAERAFDAAMAEAQAEMRPVAADANNPQTKSKYASYAALDKAVRPIYTEHGFSLSFNAGEAAAEQVLVVCRVAHRDGHARDYRLPMPADGKGAKGGDVMTKTHAAGSAISYGMRYLLKMIFNIAVGEDDDGNRAGGGDEGPISQEQLKALQAIIDEVEADLPRFCAFAGINSLPELPARDYADAVRVLQRKKAKAAAK